MPALISWPSAGRTVSGQVQEVADGPGSGGEVGGGIGESLGQGQQFLVDRQQQIEILVQLRNLREWQFSGQADDGQAFLFCMAGYSKGTLTLQGLFIDTPFTGDDPIAVVKRFIEFCGLQKMIDPIDQAGAEECVEPCGCATGGAAFWQGGNVFFQLLVDDGCEVR